MLVPEARFGVPDVCLGLQDASRCRPDGLELDSICHSKVSECFRDAHHGPYSLDSITYGHILSLSTVCVKFGAVHLRERYLEHGPRISRFEPWTVSMFI